MFFQRQVQIVGNTRIDEAPAFDLTRAQDQSGLTHTIDQKWRLCRGAGDLAEALQLAIFVVNRCLEHEDAITRCSDFGHIVHGALDQNSASHTAADLHCGGAVQVWVIPGGAWRMVLFDVVLMLA